MPQTAIDITGGATRVRASGQIKIQDGTIVALTAFALVPGTNPAGTWVEVGLMSGDTSIQHRIAILDAGYIGTAAPIGWTGLIKAEPSMYVYADVYSSESTIVRLSILVAD